MTVTLPVQEYECFRIYIVRYDDRKEWPRLRHHQNVCDS
jgi:hypothetical protein